MIKSLYFLSSLLLLNFFLLQSLAQEADNQSPKNNEVPRASYKLEDARYRNIESSFQITEEEKQKEIYLLLDYPPANSRVRINHFVCGHTGTSTGPLEFNIGPFLQQGENRLSLQDSTGLSILPGDLFPFSAMLLFREKQHIRDVEIRIHDQDDMAHVLINLSFVNMGMDREVDKNLHVSILDSGMNVLAQKEHRLVSPLGHRQVTYLPFQLKLLEAVSWGPERPYLYKLRVETKSKEKKQSETIVCRFGVRDLVLADSLILTPSDTLLLRAAPCALADSLVKQAPAGLVNRLQDQGYNAIYLNSPAPLAVMEDCDWMGMLVLIDSTANSKYFTADKNRPSLLPVTND